MKLSPRCTAGLLALGLASLPLACTSSGHAPRDPEPVIEALQSVAPPARTLPGPKGAAHFWRAEVQLQPRGQDDHALTLTARVTLDITPRLQTLPIHEKGWGGLALQKVLRDLGDHYIGELLQLGWAGDPEVLSSWRRSLKGWRIATPEFEVLSNYPPETGTAARLFLSEKGSISVVVSLRPDGMRGTPGPNLQPGKSMVVVVQVLAEERGFGALAED